MQHLDSYDERKAKTDIAIAMVRDAVDALKAEGLDCDIVGGGGTGSYYFESNSGVYNELQCGSYAFMDADYGRILDKEGNRIDRGEWENALFILTGRDEPRQARQGDLRRGAEGAVGRFSGLPVIFGRDDVEYVKCSDEHGVIADPDGVLKVNEKLRLVPGTLRPDLQRARLVCRVCATARSRRSGRFRRAARPIEPRVTRMQTRPAGIEFDPRRRQGPGAPGEERSWRKERRRRGHDHRARSGDRRPDDAGGRRSRRWRRSSPRWRGAATNFPVVREAIGHADALYGFKSGFDRESLALGLKSGGYWPGNAARGLTNHQSTVFLFDADTGRPRALWAATC